jgi:ribose 5-phosphate isomerase A
VPVEVMPSATVVVMSRIREIGGKPVLRTGTGKVGPVVTDNSNFILDVSMERISNPEELDTKLRSIPGVVETGLFIGLADIVYVGTRDTVKRLEKSGLDHVEV